MPVIRRMTEETGRFALLLAAMLLDLILAPVVLASPLGFAGERVLSAGVLVAALYVVRARRLGVALLGAALAGIVAEELLPHAATQVLSTGLRIVFLAYVLGLILEHVLSDRNVSYDTIAGAACAYVLLGLIWGQLYILLEDLLPGSFDIPESFVAGEEGSLRAALVYFSLATLTTVGYGDIHPATPGIGALATTEAIVGQLYLAVTVARLVGLHLVRPGS